MNLSRHTDASTLAQPSTVPPMALLFPGQGSQVVGMAVDVLDHHAWARTFVERASMRINVDLDALLRHGPAAVLDQTVHAQPALVTASLLILEGLNNNLAALGWGLTHRMTHEQKPALERWLPVRAVAGHSLGEYTALVAAGILDGLDAVDLVAQRGRAMQEAAPVGYGGMMAILGATADVIHEAINSAGVGDIVFIANDNAPGQIIISGRQDGLTICAQKLTASGAKAIPLAVSAPFHCPVMKPAGVVMANALAKATFHPPRHPVICNVTAQPEHNDQRLRKLLVEQLTAPVRWRETVEALIRMGVTTFWEIGPGQVLGGLVKRTARTMTSEIASAGQLDIRSINSLSTLETAIKESGWLVV